MHLAYWAPVIDGIFVNHQPDKALEIYSKNTESPRVPLMFGITSEEGLFFVKFAIPLPVPNVLSIYDLAVSLSFPDEIAKVLKLYYSEHFVDIREDAAIIVSDFVFRCPRRNMLETLFNGGKTDIWAYMIERNNIPLKGGAMAACSKRPCHGTELVFIFQTFDVYDYIPTPEDLNLSHALVDYYANFIKYGDPNGHYSQISPSLPLWQGFKDSGGKFRQLHFQKDGGLKVEDRRVDEKCDMWDRRGYLTWFI